MIARINYWMMRLLDLAMSRSAPTNERERRSRSIVRGTASALVARGLILVVAVITVPLTVRYLGAERYGAWMTISSFVVFLGFTDFGLAASLTNALGKAFGEENRERARGYVSASILALSIIAVLLVLAGIAVSVPIAKLVFPSVKPAMLYGEIVPALIITLAVFALNFPLMVTNRILMAYQESSTANFWTMAASVANLLAILVVLRFQAGLPWLVLGASGAGLVINLVSTIWLFGWHKPWISPGLTGLDLSFMRELFSTSWKFFIGTIAWMINSQTDNMIIAHYLGPAQVTPYSVTFRLFSYATLIQIFAFASLWPAYTEAYARKDFGWVIGVYRKNLKWSIIAAVAFLVPFTLFGQTIIRFWAGEVAVPPFSVIVWMAIWNLLLAYLVVPNCLLQATGHINGLVIYGTVTALANIALSIWFVGRWGIAGVIAATVTAYVCFSVVPIFLETRTVLRKVNPVAAPQT